MIGSFSIPSRIKYVLLAFCFLQAVLTKAQTDSPIKLDPIQIVARQFVDSVILRWAPVESGFWISANTQGYTIERYTLIRDGKPLAQPEKKIITATPLKPYTEQQWIPIVNNNKYAAIAAQALLGETFELDMKQASTTGIVNKVRENEQRFSIALFCADLSVATAKALALYHVDNDVNKNEKYLYRITSSHPKSGVITGSVYVSPDEEYKLPAPVKFSAEAKDNLVNLRWNQSYHKRIYTSYIVERSEDGKIFKPISDDPVSTLTPDAKEETQFQYASDSLHDISKEYHYRVKGLTPFGESGPPSEIKTVKGKNIVTALPYITSAVTADNKTITVVWDFPNEVNHLLVGFYLERSVSPSGIFDRAHEGLLDKASRTFKDNAPKQTNYYRLTAQTIDKDIIRSMTYYAQLIDSLPPSAPVGLQGLMDEYGNVTFSWEPNTEEDIYGYRVYRAYYASEEFAQLTSGPIKEAKFSDRVNIQSLNEKIHYRVMAIDNSQNHSVLSEIYSLSIPDKVPPVSPSFLPVKSKEEGVELSWMPSSSTDVVSYEIFRKAENNLWIRMTTIQANQDSLYSYIDASLKHGETRHYTIVAVDDANLKSPPAPAVTGQKKKRSIWPAVALQSPEIDRLNSKIILRWSYDETEVKLFHIYKATNDEPLKLYRSVDKREFTDRMYAGKYQYKVVAVFADGSKSEMGKGISFTF